MTDFSATIMLAAIAICWIYAWARVLAVCTERGWRKASSHALAFCVGWMGGAGGFFIGMAIAPGTGDPSVRTVAAVIGALILGAFCKLGRLKGPVAHNGKKRSVRMTLQDAAVPGVSDQHVVPPVPPTDLQNRLREHSEAVSLAIRTRTPKERARNEKERAKLAAERQRHSPTLPQTFVFNYVDSDGVWTERTVRVHSVAETRSATYLNGFCLTRMDDRTFRTDRIKGSMRIKDSGVFCTVSELLQATRHREQIVFDKAFFRRQ